MYIKTTNDITVTVNPQYLETESSPEDSHYVWSYHVKIDNLSSESVHLKSRYWKIIDAQGLSQEVRGDGVVGEQPCIDPGKSFEYTSGAPLRTPGGLMVGQYHMEKQNGETMDIEIPAFSLDSPYQQAIVN
jgi:ApaG protein